MPTSFWIGEALMQHEDDLFDVELEARDVMRPHVHHPVVRKALISRRVSYCRAVPEIKLELEFLLERVLELQR